MIRVAPFFLLIFFLVFSGELLAQKPNSPDINAISAKFPDEQCLATEEKLDYTFALRMKGKQKSFVIHENYSAGFFTTEHHYSKVNSIFYDSYSEISSLKYMVNNQTITTFPVLHSNYESEGIFHDDMQLCAYKMDMRKDKSYQVNYVKDYHNPRLFSKIYFHENYPIHKKVIAFEVPEWVEVEFSPVNFDGYAIAHKEETKTVAGKKMKHIEYEINDIPAVAREPHSPSSAKYLPHLLVFVKSYHHEKQSEKYFSTHDDIYAWCKLLVDSVQNDQEGLKPILKEIKKDETDSFAIMKNIFYWVQEHVRYIAFEDGIMGYKPASAKKVYTMLYGDCKGMANLTKNLLKLAGIDARLTWIGTHDIPYNNDLPILAVYNHMICTAFLGGKKYFLDATEDYIAVDDYAERIQGRPVMIENGATYLNDRIPMFDYERNKQEDISELSLEGNILKGKAVLSCYGEQKTGFLRGISGMKTENREMAVRNYLRGDNPDLHIGTYTTSNLNEREKPLTINYQFEKTNAVYPASNNEYLIFPEKDHDFEHLEFDSLRKNDYEFNNRYFINTTTTLTIPVGYSLKKIPGAVEIKNDDYEFLLNYKVEGSKLLLNKQIKIKSVLLKKPNFKTWNKHIREIKNFYHSPVILLKTN